MPADKQQLPSVRLDDSLLESYRPDEILDRKMQDFGAGYLFLQPVQPSPGAVEFRRDALAALPERLRRELADAVIRLDTGLVAEVIGRVSQHDPELGPS